MSQLVERVQAIAAKARSKADENRRRMPKVTAIVDMFRAEFGPGVTVTYAEENGIRLGTPDTEPGISLATVPLMCDLIAARPKERA
jgi:hypothetical protein